MLIKKERRPLLTHSEAEKSRSRLCSASPLDLVPSVRHTTINIIDYFKRDLVQNFISYQGRKFTIEWYFDDRGISDPKKYFDKLDAVQKEKIFYLFRLFGDMGKIRNKEKFRYEGSQIYAFKASPNRFLCFFFDGKKIIVASAYKKESAKMPVREKKRALMVKKDYEKRCKAGSYYVQKN